MQQAYDNFYNRMHVIVIPIVGFIWMANHLL